MILHISAHDRLLSVLANKLPFLAGSHFLTTWFPPTITFNGASPAYDGDTRQLFSTFLLSSSSSTSQLGWSLVTFLGQFPIFPLDKNLSPSAITIVNRNTPS